MSDSGSHYFFQQASTRENGSSNVAASNFFNSAAIAADNTPASSIPRWRVGYYSNSSNSLTDVRFSSRHSIGSFFALFSSACPATTGRRYDYA
jgi:hypothetical protein